jgi:hypothetical protein
MAADEADGLFRQADKVALGAEFEKIDRSPPIVAEIELTPNGRNSLLKSGARISDGSGRRFFVVRKKYLRRKISALRWLRTIEWE